MLQDYNILKYLKTMIKLKNLFFIVSSIVIMAMFTSSCACTVIDNSEVGIKFKKFSLTEQGKLETQPASGWVFYNPFSESVFTYPVFIQRVDYSPFTVTTKDAAIFSMDPVLAYLLKRDMAAEVFTKYRKSLPDIEQGYMRTCIYDAYRITANNYTSDELMSSRAKFEAEVRVMLDKSLGEEGFEVKEFTSQIDPPQSLREMIDSKNAAIQAALRSENQVKEAEAKAKIAIAEAKGEADALKIKADAEAYYNRTVAASLSSLLVQQDAIEKWDGELPAYTGGGALPFINLK